MNRFTVDPNHPLPRYYQVYSSLLARISTGEFRAGEPLPPERQLAEHYGVSRITIIKALDLLAQKQLIQRQHGRGTFVNPNDERDTQQSVHTIAFLIDGLPASYSLSLLLGIAREVKQHHCALQIMSLYGNSDQEARQILQLIDHGVHGVIVYPHPGYRNLALYQSLQAREFPVVMIDRYYPQIDTDRVVFDDVQAGYVLTSALIDHGHKRIAVVPYTEVEATSVLNRLQGYRQALAERHIPYDEDLVWLDVYARSAEETVSKARSHVSRAVLRRRIERSVPTALFALNRDAGVQLVYDLLTMNAERMRVALAQRSVVIDELTPSLAAIVDQPLGMNLPSDGIQAFQSGELLGSEAARLLIGRLNRTTDGGPRSILVPMQIEPWQGAETSKLDYSIC